MPWLDADTMTATAGGTLAQFRSVRMSTGKLAYAGASDTDMLGVVMEDAVLNQVVGVKLFNKEGSIPMIANGAITQWAGVYAAANGKVGSSGTYLIGYAKTAAGADGDQIEVVPNSIVGAIGTLDRSSLTQDAAQPYPVLMRDLAVWDAPGTRAVAATAANDDLAVVYNTIGTAGPSVETGDVKTASSTRKVGFQFTLPPEYQAGETVTLRIKAGMKTTVADTSCTVDVNAYAQDDPTTDICATAAASINSLTPANKDFTLTPTDLAAGDVLDIVISIAYVDSATGTAVIGKITDIIMLLDIQG